MQKVKWKSKALTVLAVLVFLAIGGTSVKVHAQENDTTAKEEFLSLTNKKQEENVPFQVENIQHFSWSDNKCFNRKMLNGLMLRWQLGLFLNLGIRYNQLHFLQLQHI